MEIPLEKKYNVLSQIQRASHFEWLRAAKELCPDVSELDLVLKYWEIVGHDTAKNYLKHLDPEKPLPEQVAKNYVFSSTNWIRIRLGATCGWRPSWTISTRSWGPTSNGKL
jgi:hypothetical protein